MSSSSRYTHLLRSKAEASVVKVQYPTKQSVNTNALYSSIGCNPNYSLIEYPFVNRGYPRFTSQRITTIAIYDGVNALTQSSNILDGGSSATNSLNVLSGN